VSTNAKLDHQNHNSENMAMWETACGSSQRQHRHICGLTKSYRDQREEEVELAIVMPTASGLLRCTFFGASLSP